MDVTIRTGRQRGSIFVDVRVLLEMIDRDPVDVNRGFGVSAAAVSGIVTSFAVVETVVVAIAIMRQHGTAGNGNGWIGNGGVGGCRRDAGNQMIDATSVRPLMLEKLLRCRHVRIRADSYGCVQYLVICIEIIFDLILLRYIVNRRVTTAAIRRVFVAFIFICVSLLSATSSSTSIATATATTLVQLLSVDQFHRDKLLQSL